MQSYKDHKESEKHDTTKETQQGLPWLRIHLPMQGTWVQPLVWEDPTCCGATKPMNHNY